MSQSDNLLEEICAYISRGKHSKKRCVLLYIATDKADVDEFHTKCDAQGPTVTILYGKFNSIFGGYTSKNWTSPETPCKVKDEEAFLFTKYDNPYEKCRFIPIKKKKEDIAITCGAKFGPTFGGGPWVRGYDLKVFKRDTKPESVYTDQFLHLNGSLNINNAYSDSTNQKFSIKSEDINYGKLIVRKLEGEKYDTTKRNLIDMKPLHGLNIKQYNILLVGPTGAGKSSFINTLSTVFTGKFEKIAPARDGSIYITSKVRPYPIITENKEKLNLRIYDIRGFEEGRGYGKELELLLDGRLPQNYQFPDEVGSNVIDEVKDPSLNEKIHLVCMVEAESCFDSYTPKILEHIEDIKKTISTKGLPLVVIATKLEMRCTHISKNVDHLFKCSKAKEAVSDIAEFYGVKKSHVFPVVNYISESGPVTAKNQLALKSIYDMYKLTEEYFTHHEGTVLFDYKSCL
ncbi:interferon-induced protein 44-like [Ruditapes philippinarum]|uniref:interferon-induced protein 44-like n=1 Tax=Ruditapes philippinarum TaxID=129788 RepID=UPI00295BEA93|nr:interferon-induced protein 44-like [Ruditapes philippinarum]